MYIMDIYEKLKRLTEFDWDFGNTDKNVAKHKISNSESEEVFFNPNLVLADEKHSVAEDRFFLLGRTNQEIILFVVFTVRGDKIRVISSRSASRKEKQIYNCRHNNEKRNSKI